jgi:DNA-binding NtrC family response regulator
MNATPYRIALIEDDLIMGEALADRFALEGFACDWFTGGKPAMQALLGRKHFDVAICDIQLPDINGEDLFTQLVGKELPLPPFVFVTGYGTVDRAVRLLKLGAQDYLTKPLDIHALLDTVRRLCNETPPTAAGETTLGISAAMRHIEATLPRLASNASSVLITGESGVGKEQVARALQALVDPEGGQPFIAVNCGAIAESLLEAELFGHVKGAFTGAIRERKGYFEQADGGTLFLDEIGDMSASMQVKLLRAVQERQIVRVGGEHPIGINIRLICATHRDLKQMVEAGKFREDLYYRIHVIHLHIPPLRERKEDIPWLARRLLDVWAEEQGDRRTLSRSGEQALLEHPWPGNIRELKHCLERACILTQQPSLSAELLFGNESAPQSQDTASASLADFLDGCERTYIESSLRAHGGRIADTAEALGISRKNLWEKMKKLQI